MTRHDAEISIQPRAKGELSLSATAFAEESRLSHLRQSGSFRAVFPRPRSHGLDAVLVNTAGGITGGDRFRVTACAQAGAALTLTTQAAERAYRAQAGETGSIQSTINVYPDARVQWLPQETILFDGCALDRRLTVKIDRGGTALIVEPLVFGRAAMGETLDSGRFRDRIEIRQDGELSYLDNFALFWNIAGHLAKGNVTGGAGAMASVIFAGPGAEGQLSRLRALLPDRCGASLLRPELLCARLLAADSFELRQILIPVIEMLAADELPRPWTI